MSINKPNIPFSIQKMIKEKLRKEHITPTQLAHLIDMRPISAHQMLDRPTMQVDRLWSICVALELNIFQEVANKLDIEHYNPKVDQQQKEIELLNDEVTKLKKNIELLETERNTLKEVIGLLKD